MHKSESKNLFPYTEPPYPYWNKQHRERRREMVYIKRRVIVPKACFQLFTGTAVVTKSAEKLFT